MTFGLMRSRTRKKPPLRMSEVVKDWVLKENSVKTLGNASSMWFTVDGKDPKQPVGRLVVEHAIIYKGNKNISSGWPWDF